MKAEKILTNSFLVLCIASLGITVMLSFVRENEKAKRLEAEELNAKLSDANATLTTTVTKISQEKEEISKKLDVQTKLVTDYKKKLTEQESKVSQAVQDAKKFETQYDQLKQEYDNYKRSSSEMINEYKKQNKALLAKAAKAVKEDDKKEPSRIPFFGGGGSSDKDQSVELAPVVVKSSESVTGKVMVVNRDFNFIISDIGEKDGLKMGDAINVYRDGKKIANAQVEKLYDALSASGIIEEDPSNPIQEGDTVGN